MGSTPGVNLKRGPEWEDNTLIVLRQVGGLPVLETSCQPSAFLETTMLGRKFEERISRKDGEGTDFKGKPNLFLHPIFLPPGLFISLLRDPKYTLSLCGRWKPLIVPRGEGGSEGKAF